MPNLKKSRDARRAASIEKETKVFELRKAGVTWDQIAKTVGYATAAHAHRAYARAVQRTQFKRTVEEMRELDNLRLDALLRSFWAPATKGTVAALDRVLAILTKRWQLNGVEAPQRIRVESITVDALERSIQAMLAEMEELDREEQRRELTVGGTPVVDVEVVEQASEQVVEQAVSPDAPAAD